MYYLYIFNCFQKQPLTTSEVIADSVIGNNNSKQPQYQSAQVPSNPPSSYYLNHLRVRKQSLTYGGAMLSIPRYFEFLLKFVL